MDYTDPDRYRAIFERLEQAKLASSKRVVCDIDAGVRLIENQREREKVKAWIHETTFLLDCLQSSSLDGLDLLASYLSFDVAMTRANREEVNGMRDRAKLALLSTNSPAASAASYYDKHHDAIKKYCTDVARQLEMITQTPAHLRKLGEKQTDGQNQQLN